MSFPLMPVAAPTSTAGETWQLIGSIPTTANMRQLSVSTSGVFVAGVVRVVGGTDPGSGKIFRSTDYGSTWSYVTTGSSDWSYGSAFGAGLFVITDESGDNIYSSSDGSSWTLRESAGRDNWRVKYNDGYFVVGSGTNGGNGFIYASSNGTSWTYGAQGNVGANSVRCGIYVASLNRTFAAGDQYKYVNAVPTSSTAWTGTPSGLSATIFDVAWGNSIAVAVGDNGIYSSTNLTSWTLRVSAANMYGVSWCEDQFVAVGSAGKIYTSPDGTTWTARSSGTTQNLYGVVGYNGVLIVTGNNGTVLRSS